MNFKEPMIRDPAFLGMLVGAAIGFATAIFVLIAFVRASVAMYNKLVGGKDAPSAVPEPSISEAFWMVLTVGLIEVLVCVIAYITNDLATRELPPAVALWIKLGALIITFLINFVALWLVLATKLPTTLPRALFVSLIFYAIWFFTAAIVMVAAFYVFRDDLVLQILR